MVPGSRLGRYEILSVLGSGGMGSVYRARDIALQRVVAIKVMAVRAADAKQRLRREARTLAHFNHPNIVTVYDVGEDDGQLYFVTELIDGHSLAVVLQRTEHIDRNDVIEIASQVGQALTFIHGHGFLHRDVKPSNILLSSAGRVFLSDFGLAVSTRATSTISGSSVLGTPRYMSPEQAQGLRLDARSDIYS